ncbi:MAG: hypothetical protein ACQKBV_05975, partial [Puniceicoccales bacterium]
TDPAPTGTVKLKPQLQGVHPRLIFTKDELSKLGTLVADDDILRVNWDATIANGKKAKADKGTPPRVVKSDTPALVTAGGQYPNLAYAYTIEPTPALKQKIVEILEMYQNAPYWTLSKEVDSSMGAANNMLAAALLFDAVANDLEPVFKKQFAQTLLEKARRMYYIGHKQQAIDIHKYWQQDPANNHRWHRAAGTIACLLAIQDIDGIEAEWMLEQMKNEIDFLVKWFPHDGDCHEGTGYQLFGFHFLAITATMMDRCTGTDYLSAPGFKNAWQQQIYSNIPGARGFMTYGDNPNRVGGKPGFGSYSPAFFIGPRISRDADAQAALEAWYYRDAMSDNGLVAAGYPWLMLLYYDPTLKPGAYKDLPTYKLLADMGAAYIRDSWDEDAVLMLFKCGPYGGYTLNQYRNELDFHYVNIAHDDPDANSVSIAKGDDIVLHPGVYFTNKLTANHNTLIVDGKGQINEGDSYTQPVPKVDMTTLSYLTGWKVGTENRIIIEGEAGNAYPGLEQYRRSAVWMPGEYILLLDNVVAPKESNIVFQLFAQKANFTDPDAGTGFIASKSGQRIDYQISADQPFSGAIDNYIFYGRWGHHLMDRTQFDVTASKVKFATVLDPWGKQAVAKLVDNADGSCTVTVTGAGINDTWQWVPSKDLQTPSEIHGSRGGKQLISLTSSDKAPHGDA